jgi:hypothetical protein
MTEHNTGSNSPSIDPSQQPCRSQPPIGSEQVSSGGRIVVIAYRRYWPFGIDLTRRGMRQSAAIVGGDDLGDDAGV